MRLPRWRSTAGLASLVLATVVTAVILLFAVGLTTYQQIVATRQVVSATAAAALRSAVPGALVTEALDTAGSTTATGLQMSPTAYATAVGQALPRFWAGSSVTPCVATPPGSPVACTPSRSFLLSLPPSTATALHITGPLVVTAIQLATQAPYTVHLLGQRTTLAVPAVAALVAVPLHLVIGSILTLNPWVTVGITNAIYADQGSQYLTYGAAPAGGTTGTAPAPTAGGTCWQWPDTANPACATRPAWCPVDATQCVLNPGQSVFGFWLNPSVTATLGTGAETTVPLSGATLATLPWVPPATPGCWVAGSAGAYTWTPSGTPCAALPGTLTPLPWATAISRQLVGFGANGLTYAPCYTGTLPGSPAAPSTGTTTVTWCPPPP